MAVTKPFSVIIATYTGEETIGRTFESLLWQKSSQANFEIIVVIDGPSATLRFEVEAAKKKFTEKNIPFKVRQFKKNRGRFEARMEAAEIAKNERILIIDDRIELPPDFLKFITTAGEEAIIPDVAETDAHNVISFTLGKMRRKVYGEQWGGNFKPFYINASNFDHSAKGTGAFWITRKIFIDACKRIAPVLKSRKEASDDTRLLREIVDSGVKIYKTAEVQVTYNSRRSILSEIRHIYQRGPKFIDYYLHPGRRYFPILIVFYILLFPVLATLVLFPIFSLTFLLIASITTGIFITGFRYELVKAVAGLWLILLSFGAGLTIGLVRRVV